MYQHLQLFGDMNPILRPISLLKDTLNTKTHGASSIDCGFLELQRSNRNIENLRNNTNQTQISKIIQINTKELVLNDTQHVGRDGLNNVSNERDGVGGIENVIPTMTTAENEEERGSGNVGTDSELGKSEKKHGDQNGHIISDDVDAASGAQVNKTDQNESKTSKVIVKTLNGAEKEQGPNVDIKVKEHILSKGDAENPIELAPSGEMDKNGSIIILESKSDNKKKKENSGQDEVDKNFPAEEGKVKNSSRNLTATDSKFTDRLNKKAGILQFHSLATVIGVVVGSTITVILIIMISFLKRRRTNVYTFPPRIEMQHIS